MEEAIFDQSLIVYSEHEMPNSTFAARVIASTQSDLYGALTGAVASLKGTLHGGANEAVMAMLLEAGSEANLEALMLNKLARKERIMGFGHRVYMRKADPRALLMKEALAELAIDKNQPELYNMCVLGEEVMKQKRTCIRIWTIMQLLFTICLGFRLICLRRFFLLLVPSALAHM